MSESNRGKRIKDLADCKPDIYVYSMLTGLVGLMALFWAIRSEYPYTDKSAQARYYQTQCNKSSAAGYVPFDRDIIAAKRELEAAEHYRKSYKKADYPDYCDLAAQYRAASAAESSSYGSWTSAILTLIGVIFLWRTLVYTRRTIEQTRLMGGAQTRAYLSIENIKLITGIKPKEIVDAPRSIALHFDIQNTGLSPAKNVLTNANLKFMYARNIQFSSGKIVEPIDPTPISVSDGTDIKQFRLGAINNGPLNVKRSVPDCFRSCAEEPIISSLIVMAQIDITITFEDVFGEKFWVFERFTTNGIQADCVSNKTVSEYVHLGSDASKS